MSDTHVNAFYMDVQEAEAKVEEAKAELQAAKVRLRNHPDYEAPKAKKPEAKAGEGPEAQKTEKPRGVNSRKSVNRLKAQSKPETADSVPYRELSKDDVAEANLPADELTTVEDGPRKHQALADSQGDDGPLHDNHSKKPTE